MGWDFYEISFFITMLLTFIVFIWMLNRTQGLQQFALLGEETWDKEKWRKGTPIERAAMVYDFCKNHHFEGMLKKDLISFLGGGTAMLDKQDILAYHLGTHFAKTYFLVFKLDTETDTVKGYFLKPVLTLSS